MTRIPTCAECGAIWLSTDNERWRAYLGGEDLYEPAELVFFCTTCADREFGS